MSIRHPDLSYLQSAIISHNALDDILRDILAAISGLMHSADAGRPIPRTASQCSFICLGFNDSVSAHLLEVVMAEPTLMRLGLASRCSRYCCSDSDLAFFLLTLALVDQRHTYPEVRSW
jgi:hypothetical protein